MKLLVLERALWGVSLVGAAVASWGWRSAIPRVALPPDPPTSTPAPARVFVPESLMVAAAVITQADPFRAARRPASIAYRPELEGAPPPVVAPLARPALVLRGVVGSPGAWSAVLEGVPGRQGGILVKRGDAIGIKELPLTVRSIGRDTVIVQGADTTWRLTVSRAW